MKPHILRILEGTISLDTALIRVCFTQKEPMFVRVTMVAAVESVYRRLVAERNVSDMTNIFLADLFL